MIGPDDRTDPMTGPAERADRRRVRVVVLNYDGGPDLARCIDALAATDWPGELEIVLIDNASTDGSVAPVLAAHPTVRLIQTATNLGFVANNLALADLDGVDYVALVNNDAFVDPGWLTPLVDGLDADAALGAVQAKILLAGSFAEVEIGAPTDEPRRFDPRRRGVQVRAVRVDGHEPTRRTHLVGGLGPEADGGRSVEWTGPEAVLRVPVDGPASSIELCLTATRNKTVTLGRGASAVEVEVGPRACWVAAPVPAATVRVVNNAGTWLTADGSGADRGWLEVDHGQFDEPTEIFAWSGTAVLLRPGYLRDVGLFDERLFLYCEDLDLAWRGRTRGWSYRVAPAATVDHLHAASTGETSPVFRFHNERNRLLVLVGNGPADLARRQVLRHPLVTLSYARRDVVGRLAARRRPDWSVVRVRLAAEVSFLRLLPGAWRERRQRQARRTEPAPAVDAWIGRREWPLG